MLIFACIYTKGFYMIEGLDIGKSNQECKKR